MSVLQLGQFRIIYQKNKGAPAPGILLALCRFVRPSAVQVGGSCSGQWRMAAYNILKAAQSYYCYCRFADRSMRGYVDFRLAAAGHDDVAVYMV